jgi:hypothetical protein
MHRPHLTRQGGCRLPPLTATPSRPPPPLLHRASPPSALQADSIKAQVDEFRSAASNRTEHMEERLSRVQAAYEQTKR